MTGIPDTAGVRRPNTASHSTRAFDISTWLRLAATPTFAVLALFMGTRGDGTASMLYPAAHGSPLGSMAVMYLLMSVFHSTPWLKRVSRWHRNARRS